MRLTKTLCQLAEVCGGDREASVSREISKIHDTTEKGSLRELIELFEVNIPKGEIVIVLSGATNDMSKPRHKNKYKDSRDDEYITEE